MYIEISLSRSYLGPGTLALREPDDFRSLKVVVHDESGTRDGFDEALAQVGRLAADGDAMVRIDALRRFANEQGRPPKGTKRLEALVQNQTPPAGWPTTAPPPQPPPHDPVPPPSPN